MPDIHVQCHYFKTPSPWIAWDFMLNLLIKRNCNLVEKWKFPTLECVIDVVTSNLDIFTSFENLFPLSFFIGKH